MTIAVITPSIPERHAMLLECIESVRRQTRTPDEHLIFVDWARQGVAPTLNRLARTTGSEWLAVVADDDLLDERHLEVLEGAAAGADVVYPYCRVTGRDGWLPNRPFEPEELLRANFIPATALIRRELWERLGGWRDGRLAEDHDFWIRAVGVGARIVCVPEVTWTYRFHGGNQSMTGVST